MPNIAQFSTQDLVIAKVVYATLAVDISMEIVDVSKRQAFCVAARQG